MMYQTLFDCTGARDREIPELMPLSDGVDMAYLHNTPFRIALDKFECLGITVTRKVSQLLKQNWDRKVNQRILSFGSDCQFPWWGGLMPSKW